METPLLAEKRTGHVLPFEARGMLHVQSDISRCECSAAGVEASLRHTAKAEGALCEYLQAHAIMLVVAQLFARGPWNRRGTYILHGELQCPQVLFTKVTAFAAVLWL